MLFGASRWDAITKKHQFNRTFFPTGNNKIITIAKRWYYEKQVTLASRRDVLSVKKHKYGHYIP